MKVPSAIVVILLATSTVSFGKEAYVSLTNYVTTANAIYVCTVEKDNGDKTVTIQVDQVLKGKLEKTEVLKGETGHCLIQGPVTHFMKTKERYLVFVFKNNTVGRLGGILPIQQETLVVRYMDGFTDTSFDEEEFAQKLPLTKAVAQITSILEKKDNVQPEDGE